MNSADEIAIRKILTDWTAATREGRQDDILSNHASDLLIFDVLPPLKYDSAAGYRASWDDWQPDTQGQMTFQLNDLGVTVGDDVGYAHGILQCGGTLPDGKTFSDTVRATFCFRKINGKWVVFHQHVSKPYDRN